MESTSNSQVDLYVGMGNQYYDVQYLGRNFVYDPKGLRI